MSESPTRRFPASPSLSVRALPARQHHTLSPPTALAAWPLSSTHRPRLPGACLHGFLEGGELTTRACGRMPQHRPQVHGRVAGQVHGAVQLWRVLAGHVRREAGACVRRHGDRLPAPGVARRAHGQGGLVSGAYCRALGRGEAGGLWRATAHRSTLDARCCCFGRATNRQPVGDACGRVGAHFFSRDVRCLHAACAGLRAVAPAARRRWWAAATRRPRARPAARSASASTTSVRRTPRPCPRAAVAAAAGAAAAAAPQVGGRKPCPPSCFVAFCSH